MRKHVLNIKDISLTDCIDNIPKNIGDDIIYIHPDQRANGVSEHVMQSLILEC